MLDVVSTISGTSIPNILTISGICFLLLSLTGGLTGQIKVPQRSQKWAAIIGIIFLICGIWLHLTPNKTQKNNRISDGKKSNSPTQLNKLEVVKKWPIILKDNMQTNSIGWHEDSDYNGSYLKGKRSFINSRYHWEFEAKKDSVRIRSIPILDPISDFYACLEFQKIDKKDTNVMLIFRRNGANSYRFRISISASSFEFDKKIINEWKNIIGWTKSRAIVPDAKNRMGVIAEGNKFYFFINDILVGEATDNQFTKGNIGISISIDNQKDIAIYEFTNLELRKKDS